ncbi:hypothetical protein KP509_32G000300 [Ceratopteris richardii]|uniref:TFIIS N-terminal domain-containing protein n=1 Tax=Ceratopteris richardii TaxID=49495 RepID=A0A8T2QSH5_CERRI|nr:hypothetical protein KP509_32G000300 [Ceratopteris richardii]
MEQWRSFFNNAGDDIWTIIKEAILLAAHDYPREFRERRCDIAEILFATAKRRGDVDVVRQSASMINNYRNQMDARRAMDREYANAPETTHVSGKHTEVCSAEANKDSEISRTRMRTIISSIRENLNGSMQMNSDEAILGELQRLQSLDIDVHVLKEMDIGKQVNNLRKHPNKDIRVLAKKLIRCWKEIIDDWFIHEGVRHDLHREHQTSDQDGMENERFSTGGHRYNCISLIELSEEMQQCSHLNARDSYSGLAEERGSSNRTDIAGLNNTESEHPYISMDSIPVKSSVEMQNSLARHRSRNGKEGVLSRQCTDGGRMIAHSESRSSKFLEKCESHKQNQLASAANVSYFYHGYE